MLAKNPFIIILILILGLGQIFFTKNILAQNLYEVPVVEGPNLIHKYEEGAIVSKKKSIINKNSGGDVKNIAGDVKNPRITNKSAGNVNNSAVFTNKSAGDVKNLRITNKSAGNVNNSAVFTNSGGDVKNTRITNKSADNVKNSAVLKNSGGDVKEYIKKNITFLPKFYQGIYINNKVANSKNFYLPLINKAKQNNLNVLVIDTQPILPSKEFVSYTKELGFHLVARIVVFPGGLNFYPPSLEKISAILNRAKNSISLGFSEIQFDYIRFADNKTNVNSIIERQKIISKILENFCQELESYDVAVGADIFGRITMNKNDIIGQQIEEFSNYVHTIYPMLYPSHFYGMPNKISNPYKTIFDGITETKNRISKDVKVVAYIQAFNISTTSSNLSFKDYIYNQLQASKNSGGDGFIAWNAKNNYQVFFNALETK